MANARALLIGVNHVDKSQYRGWEGPLNCPENDVSAMKKLLDERNIEATVLTTADATTHAVKDTIIKAADELQPGDFFFMYYSGHGNSIKDKSGDEFADNKDETMCLYNDQLLDDELYTLWPRFKEGVRVFVMADCCHSGTITRDAVDPDYVKRAMDEKSANRLLRADPQRYAKKRRELPKEPGEIGARVLLLSGCQDKQQSFEKKSIGHGMLTYSLLQIMQENPASYADLHASIVKIMPDFQTPNLFPLGKPNPQFESEPPFTV